MKRNFLLLASVAAGILAAIFARAWFVAKTAEVEHEKRRLFAAARKVTVLGASRTIPQGSVVRDDDLVPLVVWESGTTADNIAYEDRFSVVGRTAVHTVDASDPVLWTYLEGGRESGRGLADDVQARMRAVSIPVSGAAAVSGLVRPGDHVDVLGSFALPESGSGDDAVLVTRTVLQNVTVLATGTRTARSRDERGGASAAGYGTVTLQVTPREAEVLVFAQQMKGRLFLTLRNGSDVYYEKELPRVDFSKIEEELDALNRHRQTQIHGLPAPK